MKTDPVVVIGNFDGVHRGHAELIRTARAAEPGARARCGDFLAASDVGRAARSSAPPAHLAWIVARSCFATRVSTRSSSCTSPQRLPAGVQQKFVDTVLRPLHPVRIVVGENFRFGFRASGDVSTLAELGAGEFKVQALPLVTDGTQPGSSTLIRHAVAEGDFGRVRELSDNIFRFSGVVVRGDRRGHELGFPTANVRVPPEMAVPADGVYAGWVTRLDVRFPALAGCDFGRHQSDV